MNKDCLQWLSTGSGAVQLTTAVPYQPHPLRIQRKRTKGWRLPEGALCVSRPTIYGNPWTGPGAVEAYRRFIENTMLGVLKIFEVEEGLDVNCVFATPLHEWLRLRELLFQLRREPRQVACFCPLSSPCHADVIADVITRKVAV